jgi:hypothetical protein
MSKCRDHWNSRRDIGDCSHHLRCIERHQVDGTPTSAGDDDDVDLRAIGRGVEPSGDRGRVRQLHRLQSAVDGDLSVTRDDALEVGDGAAPLAEVDSFLNSGPNDLHYVVAVDQNDLATLRFGGAGSGMPPTGTISISYKIGGGAAGNVDAERLVVLEGNLELLRQV